MSAATLALMSHAPGPERPDDGFAAHRAAGAQLGRGSAPRGVRPILLAVVASLVWLVLVGPLTAGTGQSLSDETTRTGNAQVGECTRKWQSFGQTWACRADVTWADGEAEATTLTSPTDVAGQLVPVVVRHAQGRFNNTTGTHRRGAAHVVTAAHPHSSNGWNNTWVLSLVGVVLVWVVAGTAISRAPRR